jgi:hypothetical protein
MGKMRNACNISVRKRGGKRPHGGYRRRSEADLKMNLREIGWESMEWMHLAQDRNQWRALVDKVKKSSGSIKGGKFLDFAE